ncbi:MAG: hypothetical protein IKM97_04675 [Clostridia bacterium]|nr:hypothetical protein [Clostridia bacterium]
MASFFERLRGLFRGESQPQLPDSSSPKIYGTHHNKGEISIYSTTVLDGDEDIDVSIALTSKQKGVDERFRLYGAKINFAKQGDAMLLADDVPIYFSVNNGTDLTEEYLNAVISEYLSNVKDGEQLNYSYLGHFEPYFQQIRRGADVPEYVEYANKQQANSRRDALAQARSGEYFRYNGKEYVGKDLYNNGELFFKPTNNPICVGGKYLHIGTLTRHDNMGYPIFDHEVAFETNFDISQFSLVPNTPWENKETFDSYDELYQSQNQYCRRQFLGMLSYASAGTSNALPFLGTIAKNENGWAEFFRNDMPTDPQLAFYYNSLLSERKKQLHNNYEQGGSLDGRKSRQSDCTR